MSEPQRLDLIAPTNDQTVINNPRDPFLSRNKRWRETHVSLTMQLLPQRSDGPQYLSLSQLCLSVSLSLSLSKLCKIQKKKLHPHSRSSSIFPGQSLLLPYICNSTPYLSSKSPPYPYPSYLNFCKRKKEFP